MRNFKNTAPLWPAFVVVLTISESLKAQANPSLPDRDYYLVKGIPLDGWDAPAISNNWLWAQAAVDGTILDMEDIRPGAQPSSSGSTVVSVDGQPLQPNPKLADWWPNAVRRRATRDGVEYTGTVVAARQQYALLGRLEIHNTTNEEKTLDVDICFENNRGLHGTVEIPAGETQNSDGQSRRFKRLVVQPGETRVIRTVSLYRSEPAQLRKIVASFDAEWAASSDYWNELLEDAFTPGLGPYLSGGMPRFYTSDADAQRFYNFGVVTALMLMKNDPDNKSGQNLYVTALPDAAYGTFMYPWDGAYSTEVLAMLDPDGLRAMIDYWAANDIHSLLAVAYEDSNKAFQPGRFYAANGSSFFLAVWNYINYTGDYDFLDQEINGRTILEVLRTAADWHKTRQQWNGVAHYGQEANLFDDDTVVNYKHFVAAPVAADVWVNNSLAEIYETFYDDPATARVLRREADRMAHDLIANLYNSNPGYEGTWKQRHEDGTIAQARHSWDFMMVGTFMPQYLTHEQKQQMRDWFVNQVVRFDSDDLWVVAQDPRDGNNGEHQMEHNGRGAYPAWAYHDGWALHAMGFQDDVVKLLHVIDGVTVNGAISQGYFPNGRRCRSNWANIAGATAAAYPLHNVFDVWPDLGRFAPKPDLAGFDPQAYFQDVPVRGSLYRVSADGAVPTGALPSKRSNDQR